MSTLSVSSITTPSNTTPLVLSSANSQAAFVRIEASNNDITFGGTTKFLGAFSSSLFYSNSINAAYDTSNAAFSIANTVSAAVVSASFNTANAAYGASNSNFAVTNTVYGVANAAFASANNVAPQVTPAYNTANAAYSSANTISASLSSNWAVTNTVYGVANTALPNISSPTLAGTLTVSTSGVPQVINSTNSNTYKIALRDNGTTVGFIGGSSSNPFIVANAAVNSLVSVSTIGNFGIGTLSPSYKLHLADGNMGITSSTGAGTFQITDDSDSGRGLLLKSNHSGTGNTYIGTNSSIKNLIFGIDSIERMRLDTSGNFNVIGNISGNFPSLFQSSTQATTSSDRSLGYSTSWTDHLSVTFTTTKAGPIYAGMVLAMTYESAAVQGEAQFVLSGAASKTSQYMAVAQQSDANRARGAHSMTWMFGNCPAGSYTLTLQVRNNGSGSTWILNNYLGFDTLYTSYM